MNVYFTPLTPAEPDTLLAVPPPHTADELAGASTQSPVKVSAEDDMFTTMAVKPAAAVGVLLNVLVGESSPL